VGRYRYQRLKKLVLAGQREVLIRMYMSTVAGEAVGSAMAIGAVGGAILSVEPAFRVGTILGLFELLGCLGGGVVLGLVLRRFRKPSTKKRKPVTDVAALLPLSAVERRWFALLCLGAGVGEELIFRGFGLRFLNSLGLSGLALLGVGAVLFGLAHSYQGIVGVLLTGVIGLVLGVVYVDSGSLLWAMLVHFLFDLRILLIPADTIRELQSASAAEV
jgi:membrane protease YdiL (CAAX protease family)